MLSSTIALRSGLDSLQIFSIEPLAGFDVGRHRHISFILPYLDEVLATDCPNSDIVILVLYLVVVHEARRHHLLTAQLLLINCERPPAPQMFVSITMSFHRQHVNSGG